MDIINEATGSVASFITNRAMPFAKTEYGIEATQDLKGQISPWPPGGGTNLLPFDEIFEEGWTNTLNGITATYSNGYMRITGTNTSTGWTNIVLFTAAWPNDIILGPGTYKSSSRFLAIRAMVDDNESYINYAGSVTAQSVLRVHGFYIAVRAGETVDWNIPMMFTKGTTVPTTYSPYSNICPIIGADTVNGYHRGKNWLKNIIDQGQSANRILLGQTNVNTHETRLKAGTYTVSYKTRSSNIPSIYLKKQGVSGSVKLNNYDTKATFTVDDGTYRFWLYKSNGINYEDIYDAQIELNPSQTNYEPYQGEEQSISLVPAIYTLYPEYAPYFQGLLAGTHDFVDLGSLGWGYADISSNNRRFYSSSITNTIEIPESTSVYPNIICTKYKTKLVSQYIQAITGITVYTNGTVQIYDSELKSFTTADFKTAMSGVYIIYKLATPKTPTITDAQFKMLLQAFGATCYGGEVITTESGARKLKVTHKFIEISPNNPNCNAILMYGTYVPSTGKGNFFYTTAKSEWGWSNAGDNDGVSCDSLAIERQVSQNDTTSGISWFSPSGIIRWKDTARMDMTIEDYKEYLKANPIKCTYKLGTPILIDLPDGLPFSTYIGTNNIFCDTGDTTVQYYISVVMDSMESNLIPGEDIKSINVSQNDAGRKVRVSLFDNSVVYNVPSGYVVTGKILTPNHEIVDVEIDDIGDSYVDITIPEEAVSSCGTAMCKLRVKDSEEHPLYDVGFSVFFIEVEPSP